MEREINAIIVSKEGREEVSRERIFNLSSLSGLHHRNRSTIKNA